VIRGFQGEYRWLSNFWPSPVRYWDFECPTVEHAYQAGKASTWEEALAVTLSVTPGEAKRAGRTVTLRGDWEEIKVPFMLDLLRQKFAHAPLRQALVATRDALLVEENTWGDTFWGVSRGRGSNVLGELLMRVRDEVRS
jgi:hypothetical protein